MKVKNYLVTTTFLFFVNSLANAAVIKSIDFESETVGALPTTSTSDPSRINNINFGDPLIRADGSNQYLEFNPDQGYDQIQVGRYAYESSVRFSFDMFLARSSVAVLYFDNPTIQRFDFSNGSITAHNVAPGGGTTYNNTFDVSAYDFTQWTNFVFDINYAAELVDVYINSNLAFTSTIFSQTAGTNSVRFQGFTNQGIFGVDNILLETNPNAVPEASSIYLLAFGLLGLFGMAQRKV